ARPFAALLTARRWRSAQLLGLSRPTPARSRLLFRGLRRRRPDRHARVRGPRSVPGWRPPGRRLPRGRAASTRRIRQGDAALPRAGFARDRRRAGAAALVAGGVRDREALAAGGDGAIGEPLRRGPSSRGARLELVGRLRAAVRRPARSRTARRDLAYGAVPRGRGRVPLPGGPELRGATRCPAALRLCPFESIDARSPLGSRSMDGPPRWKAGGSRGRRGNLLFGASTASAVGRRPDRSGAGPALGAPGTAPFGCP